MNNRLTNVNVSPNSNCVWTPAKSLFNKGIYFRTTCNNGVINIGKCAKKRGVRPISLLKGKCFMCGKEIFHAKKVIENENL